MAFRNGTLLALLCILVSACGSDEGAEIQADLAWRTTCDEAGGCLDSQHVILAIDGERSHRITCDINNAGEGAYVINFEAYKNESGDRDYGIGIRNAAFTENGGQITGTSCVLSMEEEGNTYEGKCGSQSPSEAQPCQINNIEISDSSDGPVISGDILCVGLPSSIAPLDATKHREVRNSNPSDDGPMTFRMTNCRGF
ncbi:MAG: hypothetical protein R3A78_04110 [Polyangiales bacterium]